MPDLAAKAGVASAAARRPIPPFTEEHEQFRAVIRRFVAAELAPRAAEWEQARSFPDDVFRRLAELGYLGLKFPAQYGGDDDIVADAVFAEELSRCGSGGLAAGIGAHIGIALPPIARFGTEQQKQRYLVPGIRGERIAALAITEPDAGSDVASIRTHARKVDGGWLVNGAKTFITGGVRAHALVTAVRTSAGGGHHGISLMIVDRGPGVVSTPLQKLGWHASDTAEISFARRVRARREPARHRAPRLLPDHGQLPVGAAGDGARRRRRDGGDASSGRASTRSTAGRSASRSPRTR